MKRKSLIALGFLATGALATTIALPLTLTSCSGKDQQNNNNNNNSNPDQKPTGPNNGSSDSNNQSSTNNKYRLLVDFSDLYNKKFTTNDSSLEKTFESHKDTSNLNIVLYSGNYLFQQLLKRLIKIIEKNQF